MQGAFHQRLYLAGPREIDARLRGGVAVRCVDNLGACQVEAELICCRANALLRPDQDRLDQTSRLRVESRREWVLADRVNDRCRDRGAACA